MTSVTGASRLLGVVTLVGGSVLAVVPGRLAGALAGPVAPPPAAVVRLLGLRYVVQGAAQLLAPTRGVLAASAAADGLHGASMVALAVASPTYRRPAALSAVVAVLSAAVATRLR